MVKHLTISIGVVLFFAAPFSMADSDGIRLPGVIIRPVFEGAITHDSNVNLLPERTGSDGEGPESDYFGSAELRISLVPRTVKFRSTLDFWGRFQRYMDQTKADSDEFGIRTQARFGARRSAAVTLYQRYAMVDRYDRGPVGRDLGDTSVPEAMLVDPNLQERVALSRRNLFDFGAEVGRDFTDKSLIDLRLVLSDVRYDEETYTVFDLEGASLKRRLNDSTVYRLSADLGWRATDKTTVFFNTDGAIHDSEAFDDEMIEGALRVGAQSLTTEKLRFRTAIGLSRYEMRVQTLEMERKESSDRLSFEVGGRWNPVERLVVNVRGYNRFQVAVQYRNNVTHHNAVHMNASYRLIRNLYLRCNAGFRREDYLEPVTIEQGLIDKHVEIATFSARLSYQPSDRPLMIYVDARENRSVSNDPRAEYKATQISAGLNLWY